MSKEEDLRRLVRASGEVICDECGKPYRKHPFNTEKHNLDWEGNPYLHESCDGMLLKL